jgi:hypothetical protein
MDIGLDSEKLFNIFVDSFMERQNEAMNRVIKEVPNIDTETLIKRFPKMDAQTIAFMFQVVLAFGDMIVKNNESLAKVIPHGDS